MHTKSLDEIDRHGMPSAGVGGCDVISADHWNHINQGQRAIVDDQVSSLKWRAGESETTRAVEMSFGV